MHTPKRRRRESPRGERRDAPLSLQRILAATADLVAEAGFAGVSMRIIAQRLGVSATALYRHVSDKNELLDRLAEKLVREVPKLGPEQHWDRRLRRFTLGLQAAFLRYPGLNRHLVTRSESAGGQIWIETVLGILFDAGFDDQRICDAFEQFVYFINPLTLLDFTPTTPNSMERNMRSAIERLRHRRPTLVQRLSEEPPLPSLKSYARALDRLIASLAAGLPSPGGAH